MLFLINRKTKYTSSHSIKIRQALIYKLSVFHLIAPSLKIKVIQFPLTNIASVKKVNYSHALKLPVKLLTAKATNANVHINKNLIHFLYNASEIALKYSIHFK